VNDRLHAHTSMTTELAHHQCEHWDEPRSGSGRGHATRRTAASCTTRSFAARSPKHSTAVHEPSMNRGVARPQQHQQQRALVSIPDTSQRTWSTAAARSMVPLREPLQGCLRSSPAPHACAEGSHARPSLSLPPTPCHAPSLSPRGVQHGRRGSDHGCRSQPGPRGWVGSSGIVWERSSNSDPRAAPKDPPRAVTGTHGISCTGRTQQRAGHRGARPTHGCLGTHGVGGARRCPRFALHSEARKPLINHGPRRAPRTEERGAAAARKRSGWSHRAPHARSSERGTRIELPVEAGGRCREGGSVQRLQARHRRQRGPQCPGRC
jgi:hypothetical protein